MLRLRKITPSFPSQTPEIALHNRRMNQPLPTKWNKELVNINVNTTLPVGEEVFKERRRAQARTSMISRNSRVSQSLVVSIDGSLENTPMEGFKQKLPHLRPNASMTRNQPRTLRKLNLHPRPKTDLSVTQTYTPNIFNPTSTVLYQKGLFCNRDYNYKDKPIFKVSLYFL